MSDRLTHGAEPSAARQEHTRLARLCADGASLPIGAEYKSRLFSSIGRYAEQILARPDPPLHDQSDDLEALQQVTLGDRYEEWLRELVAHKTGGGNG